MKAKGLGTKGKLNKAELVDRIYGQQDLVDPYTISVEGMLMLKWFLKPIKNKNFTFGHLTEPKIRQGLARFLENAKVDIKLEEISEIGLVSRKEVHVVSVIVSNLMCVCDIYNIFVCNMVFVFFFFFFFNFFVCMFI